VGALTSKPFRYAARSWELSRRISVSPHDGLGTNVQVHAKDSRVLRVVPRENEAINECWIADRDRYSYERAGFGGSTDHADAQEGRPMAGSELAGRSGTRCQPPRTDTETRGAAAIGALASPHQTVEELYLFRQTDAWPSARKTSITAWPRPMPRQAQARAGWGCRSPISTRWIACCWSLPPSATNSPLVAQRLRQAVKHGAQLNVLHAAGDDLLCKVNARLIGNPAPGSMAWRRSPKPCRKRAWNLERPYPKAHPLGQPAIAGVTVSDNARAIAASLLGGEKKAVLLGALAQNHPAAAQLHALAQAIATASGANLGFLSPAANSVGAQLAGMLPGPDGLGAHAMLADPCAAYILLAPSRNWMPMTRARRQPPCAAPNSW